MKQIALALVAGFVFALGLGVSGMTHPEKVIGFLDVAGRWDPSLALVMVGAIGVHAGAAQWALRAPRPLWSQTFSHSRQRGIDLPLVGGAALFGLGWGAAGYCPGPALVDLAAPSPSRVTFVAAMIAGTLFFRLGRSSARGRSPRSSSETPHPSLDSDSREAPGLGRRKFIGQPASRPSTPAAEGDDCL
jgi:uncharacterized membrane protein YedE/YeeE